MSEIQGHWFLKWRKNGEMQLSNHTDAMCSGCIISIGPTCIYGLLTYLLT